MIMTLFCYPIVRGPEPNIQKAGSTMPIIIFCHFPTLTYQARMHI